MTAREGVGSYSSVSSSCTLGISFACGGSFSLVLLAGGCAMKECMCFF